MAKYEVSIDGTQYEVNIVHDDGRRAVLKVNGREYQVDARAVSTGLTSVPNPSPQAASSAGVSSTPPPSVTAVAAPAAAGSGDMQVRAPMPGLVLEVIASVGDSVKVGDVLVRLEAMKMENELQSDIEGTIKEILVAQGDEVREGEVLVVLEK